MQTDRIFVSGGAGVIGRELVPRLLAAGHEVWVGDLKPRPAEFSPRVHYRQGDLNAMGTGEWRAMAPQVFIHLAATFERSTETWGFWDENFLHNVRLSHHLMTLARDDAALRRVVFASSYLIYDPALYQFDCPADTATALREDAPIRPRNLTGMAKLAHEIELRYLDGFCANRFSTVCARIFRGFGRGSRDVVSRWVRALLAGEPITVFREDGLFDYVYAADTAEGLHRLAQTPQATGIINLGTGRAHRVAEVVALLRGHFPGARIEQADSDIPCEASCAETTLLQATLGWVPHKPLADAVAEIVAYERARQQDETAPEAPLRVLVSSASRKVPLVRAMQAAAKAIDPKAEVVAGDNDPDAVTRHVADAFWAMPPTRDDQFAALRAGLLARGVRAVLPTRDGELDFWARHAPALREDGVHVLVSPHEAVARCIDKLAFARFGAAAGLPFIPAFEQVEDAGLGPFVVKERYGAGSRELGLNLDADAARVHARKLVSPIVQPMVTGNEISIDAWLDRHGRTKGVVLRRRDRVRGGESEVTTTFSDPAIEAACRRCLDALGLTGPVVMQAILSPDAGLQVIECNARFGGASTTGIAAGLDSLQWSLREALGEDIADWAFVRCAGELRQVRMASDLIIHGAGAWS